MYLDIREIRQEFLRKEAYEVYKACMYAPTYEKFLMDAKSMLGDSSVRIYAAGNEGYIVVSLCNAQIGLCGIASARRGSGVGRALIEHVRKAHPGLPVAAETDDDAVGFYEKCGFSVRKTIRLYPDGESVRYICILR